MNSEHTTHSHRQLSWFDQNRRKLVGIGYLIGDAAIAANGILGMRAERKAGDLEAVKEYKKELATGLLWGAGGAAMGLYGNRPLEKQMEALEQRLASHFADQGITLSEELLLKAKKENDKGFFAKFEDFLYKYPTEVLNAIYTVGAGLLISQGLNQEIAPLKKLLATENNRSVKLGDIKHISTLGMGVTIMAGALSGLLIKHKSKEQIAEEGIGAFRGAFHQNASRINGGFYLANNGFTINGIFKNKRTYHNASRYEQDFLTRNMYALRIVTAGTYIGSNILLAGGSDADKAEAERAEGAKEEILRGCAQIINAQDPKLRDALIEDTAKYLCDQKELGFSQHAPKRLAARISAEFNQLLEKPATWAGRISDETPGPDAAPQR